MRTRASGCESARFVLVAVGKSHTWGKACAQTLPAGCITCGNQAWNELGRGVRTFSFFFCFLCFFSVASLRSCRLCTAPNYRSLAESGKRRSLTNSFQWCKLKRRKSKLIINQQVGEHKIQTAKTIHSIIVGLRVSGVWGLGFCV